MATDSESRPPRGASTDDAGFKRELVQLIPHLRAFARTLCGDPAAADDLAQDAMMKAWDARASFQMGTNMKAWTFMILRNQFYSEKRRSWRQIQLDQEAAERTLVAVDTRGASLPGSRRSRRRNSGPSITGICQSSSTAWGMWVRHQASASAPSPASATSKPRSSRIRRATLRMTRLSSTTRQVFTPANSLRWPCCRAARVKER